MKTQSIAYLCSIALTALVLTGCRTENRDPVIAAPTYTNASFTGSSNAPYPPSQVFRSLTWHWETHKTAALGSDLWPVTWGTDGNIYAAWGDGGGFGGSDSVGRVGLGFARIEGKPENYHGFNVNGGFNPENPGQFPKKGKASGLLAVGNTLYVNINLQDAPWPDVHHALAWSTNGGATWTRADWVFPKGMGQFQPTKFLNFEHGYTGLPAHLAGYVYLYGFKQPASGEQVKQMYFARVPQNKILDHSAYEFFQGADSKNRPHWKSDFTTAQTVFVDPNGVSHCTVVYDTALHRYLNTTFHEGPGQLGVFDAPEPWGPWTTVAYYENWGEMNKDGEGLSCEFPRKWMSDDGLTLWSIFSVYGGSAKQGITGHDRFNLVKATLTRTQ